MSRNPTAADYGTREWREWEPDTGQPNQLRISRMARIFQAGSSDLGPRTSDSRPPANHQPTTTHHQPI